MILKDGNYVAYGVKKLMFDDIEQFKEYKDYTAPGSIAYIISTNQAYQLNSNFTWILRKKGGDEDPNEVIYDGGVDE